MKNEYHNPADERNIKLLKETIDLLRKENNRLRAENKMISSLKDTIKKLQEEKIEMSQKIIDYESESLLYNASKDNKDDILLYNPKVPSKKYIKASLAKITFCFSFYGKKNTNILKDGLKNKNEEITILKNELVKKEEIISLLKTKTKKGEFKKEKCNNFSITNSGNNTKRNTHKNNSNGKMMGSSGTNSGNIINSNIINSNTHKSNANDLNKVTSAFSWATSPASNDGKKRNVPYNNEIMYEETESHLNLEKNIYKEIQNILEEKRNFILNTLTYENFSFDILKNKNTTSPNIYINNLEDIDKLIEIIKNRKQKVQKTKKSLEEKLI